MNVVAQIMGLIALVCLVLSMQQNNKKSLLKIQLLANTFYGVQYLLLNALSAASMSLVSLIRCILFYKNDQKTKKPSLLILITFIVIIIFFCITTFDGYYSLIPIVIALMYTYALWQTNMDVFRIISVIVAMGWISYNIVVGAYVAIIGSIIELTSAVVAIIRFCKYKMYYLKNASNNNINMLISFKLSTILESDKDNVIDDSEQNKILTYITKSTNEHIHDYQLIIMNHDIVGAFLIYNYEDGILLDEIYLLEEYRNKGIGSKILKGILSNHNRTYLWVYKSNVKAISLYKKLDFTVIEETETRYKMLCDRKKQ
jgi:ribosomal protein S18 acetylase RimI-like enzyme